jgi:hypothetical protein
MGKILHLIVNIDDHNINIPLEVKQSLIGAIFSGSHFLKKIEFKYQW